jgi:hypothetical protein
VTETAEAAFEEPWQARAFALAQGVLGSAHLEREDLRSRLIAAIAEEPERPYWDSWVVALEKLAIDHRIASAEEIAAAVEALRVQA